MQVFKKSERTTLHRFPKQGSYDQSLVHDIIDRTTLCHVGFLEGSSPVVIPCLHGREGDMLYFHGARTSRLMQTLVSGSEVCASFTIFNGLVMARSAFSHSAQYESVIAYGAGFDIVEEEWKLRALKAISDHLYPGRWEDVRPPTAQELAATCVAGITIAEASAKVSAQGPEDRESDLDWPAWAGVIPSRTAHGPARQDPAQSKDIPFPGYLAKLL
jgi:nitroimidazol reductase NimA-like FMN-containing flavoprotein (pyridoxamine 5'-phosphate oxidase superfamily)